MLKPHNKPLRPTVRGAEWLAVLPLLTAVGCYNSTALVERTRKEALRTRVEEVDLGNYSVTMPRDVGAFGMTEVQIQPFGRTVRYKLDETQDAIEEKEYLVRHAIVLTIRSASLESFADPELSELRAQLLTAVHEALDSDAIDSIGIRDVRFIRH